MTFMPAGDFRRTLRGHGHAMSPIVQIGKSGVTDAFIKQVTQALADHELIKVKIGSECPVDRHDVAERLNSEPGVNIVQMVGRVLLLYKRHPRAPRYEGKKAQAASSNPSAPTPSAPKKKPRRAARRTRSRPSPKR